MIADDPVPSPEAKPMIPPVSPPANGPLSVEFHRLAERFADQPVRLGDVAAVLEGRGFSAVLVFLALPFVTPVPLPLLSTVFGTVIALAGLRMARGRLPTLPARFGGRELPGRFIPSLLRAAGRFLAGLERWLKPRFNHLQTGATTLRVSGVMIAISGLLLLLPLPVPFSNFFPALTVLLLAAGALTRDGLCFVLGCVQFVLALAFFGAIALGGSQAVAWLVR